MVTSGVSAYVFRRSGRFEVGALKEAIAGRFHSGRPSDVTLYHYRGAALTDDAYDLRRLQPTRTDCTDRSKRSAPTAAEPLFDYFPFDVALSMNVTNFVPR